MLYVKLEKEGLKMKKKFIVLACTALLLAGCGKNPKLQDGKEVIASMKDKNITVYNRYYK